METLNSKVLLFGEYSILYNSMALVMPFSRFTGELTFDTASVENKSTAIKSNEYLRKFCGFISSHMDEEFVLEVKRFEQELDKGLFFKSNIPMGSGLGSSGALVSAIFLRYLKKAKEVKDDVKTRLTTGVTPERLKSTLAQLESYFHGNSSGIDPLTILLNQPVLIWEDSHIETVDIPVEKTDGKHVIFLINTNIPRETSQLVAEFKKMCSHKDFRTRMEDNLIYNTNESIKSFLNHQQDQFYTHLSKLTQYQLDEMSAFTPESYHKIIAKGLDNGDYFLKLCGAGGGGFILGFTKDWAKTEESLSEFNPELIYRY